MASFVRRVIKATSAAGIPKAVGPFSQAVIADRTMYIAGQIGFNPSTMEMVKGGTVEEAEQVLKILGNILNEAGATYKNVVKTTVLLNDIADLPAVNTVFGKYFSSARPVRTAFQVAALPMGALVEIEAIAVLGKVVEVE